MELNEREKLVLFQIDGTNRSSILGDLNTIAKIVPDHDVIRACKSLIGKLSRLSDDECAALLMDVQLTYNPELARKEKKYTVTNRHTASPARNKRRGCSSMER